MSKDGSNLSWIVSHTSGTYRLVMVCLGMFISQCMVEVFLFSVKIFHRNNLKILNV